MSDNKQDKAIRWVVTLLAIATFIRVWFGTFDISAPAYAQIPDTGKQRQHMIAESQKTNQLLQEILDVLRSDTLSVKIEEEKASDKNTNPSSRSGKRK